MNDDSKKQGDSTNPVGFPQGDGDSSGPVLTPIDPQTPLTTNTDVPSIDSPIPQDDGPVNVVPPSSSGPSIDIDNSSTGMNTKRVLATVLGLVLLVAGVATGVYLVGQQQRVSTRALECSNYVFGVTASGEVTVRNGTTQVQVAQQAKVYIDGQLVQTFSVPELQAGQAVTIGTVTVPSGGFTWRVEGAVDCETSGNVSSAGTGQSSTSCSAVVSYDTDWNELTASDLSDLTAGDTVRFAVTGTTSQGTFEAAKFTINGTDLPETTNKRSGTNEFYMDYEIPTSTTDFEVKAKIRHSSLGWF